MRKLSCASVAPSPCWSNDWTRLIIDLFLTYIAQLINGCAHLDPKRFGLIAARDHAAIIIAKHNHGRLVNGSVKDALAGDIEVIAVHQGKDRVHARLDDSRRRSGGE